MMNYISQMALEMMAIGNVVPVGHFLFSLKLPFIAQNVH